MARISYGWILSEKKAKISEEASGFPNINVYFPNVPTIVTGQVFAARKDILTKIANRSSEVISLAFYSFAALQVSDIFYRKTNPPKNSKRDQKFSV